MQCVGDGECVFVESFRERNSMRREKGYRIHIHICSYITGMWCIKTKEKKERENINVTWAMQKN